MPFRGKKITILTIELRSLGNIERKTGNEYGHIYVQLATTPQKFILKCVTLLQLVFTW